MHVDLYVLLGLSLIVSVCAFAMVKGGSAERAGSLLIMGFYVADDIALVLTHPHFPTLAIFIGDFILALCLLFVALRYSSLWLGCAMMLQSIALCSQGLAFGGEGLDNLNILRLNNVLSVLMLCSIVAATVGSWRRRLRARRVSVGDGSRQATADEREIAARLSSDSAPA